MTSHLGPTSAVPIGMGGLLINCHADTEQGQFQPLLFVDNALLLVRKSIRTEDYHEVMNAEVFETSCKDLLRSLEKPPVIFMDNAPYQSLLINMMPMQADTKSVIINSLREHEGHADL